MDVVLEALSSKANRGLLNLYIELICFSLGSTKMRFENVYITILNRICVELLECEKTAFSSEGSGLLDVSTITAYGSLIEIIIDRYGHDNSSVVMTQEGVPDGEHAITVTH